MEFRSHGEFDIKVVGDVLFIDAKGPFNNEVVQDFQKSLVNAITLLEATPHWYQVAVLHDMSIFTPDAMEALAVVMRWRMSKGMVGSAVITGQVVGERMARKQIGDMYDQLGMRYQFFNDLDSAMDWIDSVRAEGQILPE